ncbi:MAG: VCBS repeat-containing protein, partial [Draconibacterium sp.]|nr:VCBS repeat-containing protein [Draconibacterium sp.]
MKKFKLIIYIFFAGLAACSGLEEETPKDTLFKLVSPAESGFEFTNNITNLKDFNIFLYRNFYNGGGVGIGDINNDGLADVYMTSNMEKNKLFLNKGDFQFEDITINSGSGGNHAWSTGVVFVDINSDGFLDIYVCNAGNVENDNRNNELFINNGDLTFTEKAEEYGLNDNGCTTHAAFFDYDMDGDLDVYILNNSFIPVNSLGFSNKRELRCEDWDMPDFFKTGGDKLLRNDNNKFVDVSEEAGIFGSLIGFGMGVTVGDINHDLLPDIYVSNDFYERDYLYINQGDGTFTEEIKERMNHISLSSMGADMADINNDGYPEIFVTDMLPEGDERLKNTSEFERYNIYNLKQERDFYHQYMQNTLQLNNQDGTFSEIGFYSGVAETDWSWGALMLDMDNDGYRDIYVANGIYHDLTNMDFMNFFANEIVQRMTVSGKKEEIDTIVNRMPSTPIPNYGFKNNDGLTFSDVSKNWGLADISFSNGSAYGDLDNDGDLDLVVNNINQPAFLYKNRSD